MRLSFKIILAIWLGMMLILTGVVYNAYSKLRPETLITIIREQVERNYPGSRFSVGDMKYRFSLDFKIRLKEISLERSGKKLASVSEIEIKIPWWLFLSHRGTAQINVAGVSLLFDHKKIDKVFSPAGVIQDQKVSLKLNVPTYLMQAKFTLRAKDISLRDSEDLSRKLSLKRLLVREFQIGKNSAFEATIPIEVNHNQAKYDSELWIFGDVTPKSSHWTVNYRGEFKTRDTAEKFQLEDVTIDGKADVHTAAFQLFSNMNFLIEKENVGTGKLVLNKDTFTANIEFKKFPLSYLGIIYEEIKNPFLAKLEGYAEGSLIYEKTHNTSQSELHSKVSFDGVLPLSPEMSYAGKWNLSFDDAKWETSFITPNGEVSFFRRSIIDFESGSLIQFNEEIGFSNVDFGKAIAPVKSLDELLSEPGNKYYVSTISFKECLAGADKINGDIKYGRSPDLSFYQANLAQADGKLRLALQQKGPSRQIEMEMNSFPWMNYKILAPFFNTSSGKLTGKLQGRYIDHFKNGEWIINLGAKDLKEPNGELVVLIEKVLKPYSLILTDGVQLNAVVKKDRIDLKTLTLESSDPAKINGTIMNNGKGSFLILSYPKNKRWKPVRKELLSFEL